MKKQFLLLGSLLALAFLFWAAVATNIDDFFLPGSQDGQSGNLEHPDKCDNCHGGYDLNVEPAFNWRGSMMAQAMRDPLYLAALAIANQDAPESGDLCIRCHAPDGWLNGRSIPTDASALNNNDREGVQCDFCHKLVKPTELGNNPYPNDNDYTTGTYQDDQEYLGTLTVIPPQSGNGMFVVHSSNAKRGPYVDAPARHQMSYSPFHSEADICGTCHDVSNPAFTKQPDGTYLPNSFGEQAPNFGTYMMLPVERTFSEWKMSAYNTPEGIPSDVFGGNKANVSTCQDCHMQDVTGYGCNKKGAPLRNDLPLHDFTGGNTFVPSLIAELFPEEVNQSALIAGIQRATQMLKSAATMNLLVNQNENGFDASVEVINETGHKLPSGYPEGRRIWINLKAYDIEGNLIYESGAYNEETAELNKEDAKIYEIKLGMSELVASTASATGTKTYTPGESFHFVLNDMVVKDNRIPPRGFTNENFKAIQSPIVAYNYSDGSYSDITNYTLPAETFRVNARLLYQTASKEFVEFLRDENRTNDAGQVLYFLWESNGKSKPVVMNETDFYNGTPPVKNITVTSSTLTRYSAKGGKTYIEAIALVADDNNNPISGATVSGQYSGPTSNSVSGITDESGYVILASTNTKRANGTWCLEITDISKSGYEFTDAVITCEGSLKSTTLGAEGDTETEPFFIYPNPATDLINIKFTLNQSEQVVLEIYNMAGAKIETLENNLMQEGLNELQKDISHLPTGTYIITLSHSGKIETTIVNIR